jgi:MFS family permease
VDMSADPARFGANGAGDVPGTDANPSRTESRASNLSSVAEINDTLGWSTYQWRLFVVTGLCIAAESVEVNLLSFLTVECAKEWNLTGARVDHVAGSVFAGEVAGCVLFGLLADAIGRRPTFAMGTVLVAVFGLATAFARNLFEMTILGFGVGLGIGGFSVPYDLLCEFCPNAVRGVVMMALWIFWTFGSFMVLILASTMLETQGWRMLCIYCAIPSILSMFGLMFVDESPHWLVIKGRRKEADAILRKAAEMNRVDLGEFELESEDFGTLDVGVLFRDGNAYRTILIWTCQFCQTFIYYGIVLYLPRAFARISGPTSTQSGAQYPYWALILSCAGEFVAAVIVLYAVQRYTRSQLIFFSFLVFACSFPFVVMDVPDVYMVVLAMIARMAATNAGNVCWLASPEAYPTNVRATGHGWANLIARIGALVTTYCAGWHDHDEVAALYACVALIGAAAGYMLPPGVMPGSEPSDKFDAKGRLFRSKKQS